MRARQGGRNSTESTEPVRGTPIVGIFSPGPRARAQYRWVSRALLAICLSVLWAGAALADPQDGELRLQGGTTLGQGRVEVYHDGEWGAVCDDYRGLADAKVACRQLGYPGATTPLREFAGPTDIPVWLDNMNCSGSEASLVDCDGSGWGPHNPQHRSTVGESVNKTSLSFTTENWSTPQMVTVTAAGDSDTEDDTVTLTHSPSGGDYGSVTVPDPTVRVEDNDISGATVQPDPVTIDEGDAAGESYSFVLAGEPTGTVTITTGGTSGTDVTVNPTSLTFTTFDWETAQTVSVSAAEDDNSDSDAAWITLTASGDGFGSASVAQVAVEVTNDDRELMTTARRLTLDEGASATCELRAKGGPATTVTVGVPSKLSVNPTSLSFDSTNWSEWRTVTVDALMDADAVDERQTVTHTASAGSNSTRLGNVLVSIEDDDDPETLIGARPQEALWWAALTARSERDGTAGLHRLHGLGFG